MLIGEGQAYASPVPLDADLTARLQSWADEYPNPESSQEQREADRVAEDEFLDMYAGLNELPRAQVVALVEWKFQSMPHRRTRALEGITEERWDIQAPGGDPLSPRELIRRALAAGDDAEALHWLCPAGGGVYGFGPAMGSVVLAACRPDRFTIADTRALGALRSLGLYPSGPKSFREADWIPYLGVCREIADQVGFSLRNLDRALWVAGGGEVRAVWAYAGYVLVRGQQNGKKRIRRKGAMYHRPDCSLCNGGLGAHGRGASVNGRWIRFDSMQAAKAWTTAEGYLVQSVCTRCRPR